MAFQRMDRSGTLFSCRAPPSVRQLSGKCSIHARASCQVTLGLSGHRIRTLGALISIWHGRPCIAGAAPREPPARRSGRTSALAGVGSGPGNNIEMEWYPPHLDGTGEVHAGCRRGPQEPSRDGVLSRFNLRSGDLGVCPSYASVSRPGALFAPGQSHSRLP